MTTNNKPVFEIVIPIHGPNHAPCTDGENQAPEQPSLGGGKESSQIPTPAELVEPAANCAAGLAVIPDGAPGPRGPHHIEIPDFE